MLVAKLLLTAVLALDESPRFRLVNGHLEPPVALTSQPASKRCTTLFPTPKAPPAPFVVPRPDAAVKKSLAEAFGGGRLRGSTCVYGPQGVRRQDPRYGMQDLTVQVAPPLWGGGRARLLLRTVLPRYQELGVPEFYAGVGY